MVTTFAAIYFSDFCTRPPTGGTFAIIDFCTKNTQIALVAVKLKHYLLGD